VAIGFRKAPADIPFLETEEIHYHRAARPRGEIATVAIGADMPIQPLAPTKAEIFRLGWRDDEARAMQLHARRT